MVQDNTNFGDIPDDENLPMRGSVDVKNGKVQPGGIFWSAYTRDIADRANFDSQEFYPTLEEMFKAMEKNSELKYASSFVAHAQKEDTLTGLSLVKFEKVSPLYVMEPKHPAENLVRILFFVALQMDTLPDVRNLICELTLGTQELFDHKEEVKAYIEEMKQFTIDESHKPENNMLAHVDMCKVMAQKGADFWRSIIDIFDIPATAKFSEAQPTLDRVVQHASTWYDNFSTLDEREEAMKAQASQKLVYNLIWLKMISHWYANKGKLNPKFELKIDGFGSDLDFDIVEPSV